MAFTHDYKFSKFPAHKLALASNVGTDMCSDVLFHFSFDGPSTI